MAGHASNGYLVHTGDGQVLRVDRNGVFQRVQDLDQVRGNSCRNSFAYQHIFGYYNGEALPSEQAVSDLGEAMMAEPPASRNSTIPAGYTYLGQFVFHDLSFMSPEDAKNRRSPGLDLDSVLPEQEALRSLIPSPDPGKLDIGCTIANGWRLPEDLPRATEPADRGRPLIADARNDDFLPLAQSHLALLKFYNAILRWCGWGCDASTGIYRDEWLQRVRELWVTHFQSVVLHDYLERLIDDDTYTDVLNNGRQIVHPEKFADQGNGKPTIDADWLPLEFAVAVGRFGHSMIRDDYEHWNCRRRSKSTTVNDFMQQSYRNGGMRSLHNDWTTNWFRLFDFSETGYAHVADRPIMAAMIDTRLAKVLARLPESLRDDPGAGDRQTGSFNLARETLVRGQRMGLATAQRAIEMVNEKALTPPIVVLSEAGLVDGEAHKVKEVFHAYPELRERTPLWYYTLKEAEVRGRGNQLGPLGGRIVMETLHAAIEASAVSILRHEGWRPTLPRARASCFTMPDLLAFAGNPNPLGN